MSSDVVGMSVLHSFQKTNFVEEMPNGQEIIQYDHFIDYHAFRGIWNDEIGGIICEDGNVITVLDPVIAYREGMIDEIEMQTCQRGGWHIVIALTDDTIFDMHRIGFVLPESVTVLKGAL